MARSASMHHMRRSFPWHCRTMAIPTAMSPSAISGSSESPKSIRFQRDEAAHGRPKHFWRKSNRGRQYDGHASRASEYDWRFDRRSSHVVKSARLGIGVFEKTAQTGPHDFGHAGTDLGGEFPEISTLRNSQRLRLVQYPGAGPPLSVRGGTEGCH